MTSPTLSRRRCRDSDDGKRDTTDEDISAEAPISLESAQKKIKVNNSLSALGDETFTQKSNDVVMQLVTVLPDEEMLPMDSVHQDAMMDEADRLLMLPQTPPRVAVPTISKPNNLSDPCVQIDPLTKLRPPPLLEDEVLQSEHGLVVLYTFPIITTNGRVCTRPVKDVYGQRWQFQWLPLGPYVDGSMVCIAVEMVKEEEEEVDNNTMKRMIVVQTKLFHSQFPDHMVTEISEVVTLTSQDCMFYMQCLPSRDFLLHTSVPWDGTVVCEINLCFVMDENVAKQLMDREEDLVTNEDGLVNTITVFDEEEEEEGEPPTSPPPVLSPINKPSPLPPPTPETHDLTIYDSKQETGMVGLKNQGATCYMNSLLQTLFHLRAFRHIVYATPTEQEDTNESVSLALQRVFYRLQRQQKAVSTKELTRSFGWSQVDAFMQHDVQELYRILCDRLEEKMKHTAVDLTIKRLFEGKVRSFVQCINVNFQSFRDESFYDLQLDVKGCKDVYESFQKYVEIELLQDENQYEAEGYGKQDAKKGIQFLQFPPVLNIQLKRFEYDPTRDGMIKIHDRFEYPKKLVLDTFLPKEEKGSLIYHLHSVLVHSGDVHGGHYYVFIRPGKNFATSNQWFRFDDDQITRVDETTAIEGNYGSSLSNTTHVTSPSTALYGSMLSPKSPLQGNEFDTIPEEDVVESSTVSVSTTNNGIVPLQRSFSSAYMLVYVRDGENDISSIDEQHTDKSIAAQTSTPCNGHGQDTVENHVNDANEQQPVVDENEVVIPEPLLLRFHEEEKAFARRKKHQQTEHLYMTFRIVSDTSIVMLKRITKTVDFAAFGNNGTIRIRVKRTATIRQLYIRVYKRTGVPVSRQRLWKIITRENRTHRPEASLSRILMDCSVGALIDEDISPKTPVRLYLQIVDDEDVLAVTGASPTVIHCHFLKEFTPPEEDTVVTSTDPAETTDAPDEEEDEEVVVNGVDNKTSTVSASLQAPLLCAPTVNEDDILLFIKFYDVTKPLGERLEYKGNVLFDPRQPAEYLEQLLYEALDIPDNIELSLYEEVQPQSIQAIDLRKTLESVDIQTGDIIVYQYVYPENRSVEEEAQEQYPDVPSYFKYLLDRVEVSFFPYDRSEEDPIVLPLLYSNVYDEIIDALATTLGLLDKRLYLRLYQHSPLSGLPKKQPLRHAKCAGDTRTTLDELLTEYAERSTIMYYEILSLPITEIEAKKQVIVYFSEYDECFRETNASHGVTRRMEFFVDATSTVTDLLVQVRQLFELEDSSCLRVCEITHNGTLFHQTLSLDTLLEKYWYSGTTHEIALLVEKIYNEELVEITKIGAERCANGRRSKNTDNETSEDEDEDDMKDLCTAGIIHFNYQVPKESWIHSHGTPCVVSFRKSETVTHVRERIRRRIGVPVEMFDHWPLAIVRDGKASTLEYLWEDLEPDMIQSFPISQLEERCDSLFQYPLIFGLLHDDLKSPVSQTKSSRRLEQGIRIRQS